MELNDNFWKWFKDSKMVNDKGEPIIFYHGTNKDFEKFEDKYLGKRIQNSWSVLGHFFTSDEKIADKFSKGKNWSKPNAKYPKGAKVMAVYLNLTNPLRIPVHKIIAEYNHDKLRKIREDAIKDGYDGLIIGKWQDSFGYEDPTGELSTEQIVAFYPNQIKSVDNKGTWSDTENIYENNVVSEKEETLPELNDNFWRWFGDSKVVNPDGTPKIVSHRTNKTFDSFDKSKISSSNLNGKGFYFSGSDDKGKKDSYGKNIGYYYLKMENPVRKSDWIDRETLEKYFAPDVVEYIFNNVKSSYARQGNKVRWVMVFFNLWNYKMDFGKDLKVEKVLKNMGYDGIIDDEVEDTYVVFEPNQIKSVNNKGEWSKSSDNIYETLNKELEKYL